MKKNKLLLLSLLALVFPLAGCNKGEVDNRKINIIQDNVVMDLFSTFRLDVDSPFEGTVLFSSSNPEIVSVDKEGLVETHRKEGEAIITAKVGDHNDTCKFTVSSEQTLNIDLEYDVINIEKGYTFRLPYEVTYGFTPVSNQVDLQYTFSEEGLATIIDVVDESAIGIFAKDIGQTDLTIFVKLNEKYVSKLLHINIVNPSYVVFGEGLSGEGNSYLCNLYVFSENPNHMTKLDITKFKVFYGDIEIPSANINFQVEDTNVAFLTDHYLLPNNVGETMMSISYLDNVFNVKVVVNKERFVLDKHVLIDKHVDNVIDFSKDNIVGDVIDIRQISTGKSLFLRYNRVTSIATIDNNLISFDVKELGKQPLEVITTQAIYEIEGQIYTVIVRNLDDLRSCTTICEISDGLYGGYVILANDIDLEHTGTPIFRIVGPTGGYVDESHGFCGTFDGNGYAIKNYETSAAYTSLFGSVLHSRGLITNLAITNVSLLHAKTSAITNAGFGTISNVYIQITKVTRSTSGGGIFARWIANATPQYKGVYIDYGEKAITADPGFIPTSFQDAGKQLFAVVNGTYDHSHINGVQYSTYAELNKDLVNQKGYLPFPYWNTEKTLEFAYYHTIIF